MQKMVIRRPEIGDTKFSADLHPILQRIYQSRGIASLAELEQEMEHLLPYTALKGMEEAVACLSQAVMQQQAILILGDFDADGATSSALAVSALQSFGVKQVSYLVPNRFEYGYGLTPEIVEVAAQRQPAVLVTVDNGISSIEGVARAKALGMRVVITDHHLAGSELPAADAIVNPNQPGDTFASKNLAGVGVIFYVMLALRRSLRDQGWFAQANIPEPNMANLLDLVALGTVADVVPLDKNNRILVQQGLRRIRAGKARPGILALLQMGNRDHRRIVAADLGFAVGPRLNAAGRLEDMSLGIECLLAPDALTALPLAAQLDTLNKERREIEGEMQQQAVQVLKKLQLKDDLPLGVCLFDATWHQGVIGIVASRIKDRLHRPVIAFAAANAEELKGSARSIQGLHIRDVLDAIAKRHPHLIRKFGGHAMAAGLSLHPDHFVEFSQAFAEEVARQVRPEDLQGKMVSDGALTGVDFSVDLAEILRAAGPWGQGFPEPLFDNHFELREQRIVGGKHLKLRLGLVDSAQEIDAIAFNVDVEKWPNHRASRVHAAYKLDVNEFRGKRNVQLLVEHLEVVEM